MKLGQDMNDIHVDEIFSQPKRMATANRFGLALGLVFDMSRSCWNLNDQVDTERLWKYLQTERPMLVVGSPKCKVYMEMQSMDQASPKFRDVLDAGVSHLQALMAVQRWQVAQERRFCMKIWVTNGTGMSRTCALRRECLEFT